MSHVSSNLRAAENPLLNTGKKFCLAGILIYAVIFALYFPKTYSIMDEGGYLNLTYLYRAGHVTVDRSDFPHVGVVPYAGHLVPHSSPIVPFLLLPFTYLGWRGVFLTGFIAHLAGAWFFRNLLSENGIKNDFWTLLYLFFPGFVLYSRTLMTDVPAIACMMAGLAFALRPRPVYFAAGFALALAVLFRPPQGIVMAVVGLFLLWNALARRQWLSVVHYSLGAAGPLALLAAFNVFFYGNPLMSGYVINVNQVTMWAAQYFLPHALFYLGSLTLVYPLMLPAFFAARTFRRPELLAAGLGLLLFYSFYFFRDRFALGFLAVVFNTRFIYPVAAMLLPAYCETGERMLEKMNPRFRLLVMAGIFTVLAGGSSLLQIVHQRQLDAQWKLKEMIYSSTPERSQVFYDSRSAELIQKIWGERQYSLYEQDNYSGKYSGIGPHYLVLRDRQMDQFQENERLWIRDHFRVRTIHDEKDFTIYEMIPKRTGAS